MPRVSGDGFVTAADGRPRWGRFGAAGVLVRHVDRETGEASYFLARRSEHTHLGGTWAIPGGALDHGEEPIDGALREFGEEVGVDLSALGYVTAEVHEDD
ncbi:MAG TPA: NUDIX domain-containing protein, partial [Acidimicrobiales bacterium]